MMQPSSSQLQYRPTTLERAHASHLLQTYFQTPHTSTTTTDNNTPLRISGRSLVPFLTTSNISRPLLRLFWSVVDPEAVGTLLSRNQFHVLLRLVAMAQAHFLPPLTTTTDEELTEEEKIGILTKTLEENAHLVIALPTFSADRECPSVAYLLGTYSSQESGGSSSGGLGMEYGSSEGNVSSMLMNHDLQFQMWQQQQNQQQQQQNQQGNVQGVHMMSVSDAFGSLPEVEDRPLPSLQMNNAVTAATTTTTTAAACDVGNVNPSLQPDTVVEDGNDNGVIAAEGNPNDDDFGDFTENNPIPPNETIESHIDTATVIENDDDDFGGFESTPHNNNNNDSDVKTESSADVDDDIAADFGDFSSDTFQAETPVNMTASENNIGPSITENATIENSDVALGNNVGNTVSISDAFASLGNQEDPPVQFGQMNAFDAVLGDANVLNESDNVEEEDDDDDFGNFGSASTSAASAPPPPLEEKKADDEFTAEYKSEDPTTSSSFGMSAFDAFGDVEDKPLPPLGGFPSIEATNPEEPEAAEDDGFGFGSFEASVEEEPSNSNAADDDNFGTFEGVAGTALTTEHEVVAQTEESFGTFEDAGQETADSKEQINVSQVEDSFGTFEGADGEGKVGEIGQNTITSDFPSASPSDDPFGSLPEVENLPLPPLQSPFFEENKTLEAPATEEMEDDFGDFGSVPTEAGVPDEFQSTHSDVEHLEQMAVSQEDGFMSNENNAAATENNAEITSNDDAAEDDFGAFGDSNASPVNDASNEIDSSEQPFPTSAIDTDAVLTSEEKKSHEDENNGGIAVVSEEMKPSFGMSAFDAFGDIEDAPLPPLSGFAPIASDNAAKSEESNDEIFGAFDAVATEPNDVAPATSMTETPCVDAPVEDSFGTFEGAAEETAETEPNDNLPVDDSFGTFEGIAQATDPAESKVDDPVEDSFGTFEGAEDNLETMPNEDKGLGEGNFGTFGGVGEEDDLAEREEVTAPSFSLPSPSPSDPFGSLPEVENLPLPPLSSPPLVDTKVVSEFQENPPDPANDDFGDFGSVPIHPGNGESLSLRNESTQMDEDDFGGFESSAPQVNASEEVITSAADASNGNTSEAINETHAPLNIEEDDFGNFGEAEVPAPLLNAATTNTHDAANMDDDDDDFGDFGEAQIPAPPLYTTPAEIDNAEEDFGDFGEAEVPELPRDMTAAKGNGDAATKDDEDGFGDFGEAEVPVPPMDSTPTKNDNAEDDFGFGDWGSGDWQGQTSTANEPASTLVPDILTSGFDAFSDQAQELSAAPPTTPSRENEDDFGDFEAPKSDVAQDEGSEGFVFVENSESNSQLESFGDFSSPANESFSPFDSGADEEKIMQPQLEDNADDFGDFSSFDDGAQQPEEVAEEIKETVLSRQDLIGAEYADRMERWASVMSAVKSDVARGQKIIEYISNTLPPSDRAIIYKSSKLQNHFLGLGEFIRIVRCIAATIADVFCLSDNIDLQTTYLAEWNDNPIIADAITIETLWSDIISRALELDILPQPPVLETVVEIRKRANAVTVQQKSDLCHLTLQPFEDKKCTQASVDWNGNKYMACAANFLLNRLS